MVIPSVLGDDLIDRCRLGLDYAVRATSDALAEKGLPALDAGIAHHILPAHPVFSELIEEFPCASVVKAFLGGSFILNSIGGLMNKPETEGAYLHNWHRDLRAYTQADDLKLMLNALINLDPFTVENGGTLVDLGSHHIPEQRAEKTVAQLECPAGSLLFFDSRLWHAAGQNRSKYIRRAITLTFTPPFFKPQIDHVKQLGADRVSVSGETLKKRLGWYARVPESLDDWYQPAERRFYREDR